MFIKDTKRRYKKKIRIRRKVSGTAERPRLVVFRSLKQIYAQMIDDQQGKTLVSASSLSKEIEKDAKKVSGNIDKSKEVGKLLAKKAIDAGIKEAVFDRAGYRYHGRVKAVAEGAREGGIKL